MQRRPTSRSIFMFAATIMAALINAQTTLASRSSIYKSVARSIPPAKARSIQKSQWAMIPRGGAVAESSATKSIVEMATDALSELKEYMSGAKSDTLLLLLTTALIPPISKALKMSPILGFLANGILLGPKGFGLIKDVHTTEMLADLGIVMFLFEMGIHLNFETLLNMRNDVFGLGLSQFTITAIVVALVAHSAGMSAAAMVVLGGGLALSSSAFVLQLLKDKDQLSTEFGRSSFGVLLLQDLMVVPLLVITPLLAGSGDGGVGQAVASAILKTIMALSGIAFTGVFLLNPLFEFVASARSQEAFIGLCLATVLGMSFLTEGLGLSNTLGAFLAGVLLSDTKYRHMIETEVSPYRGILVGLFFFTVGFEIDLNLIMSEPALIASIVVGIIAAKAFLATVVCLAFGKGMAISQQAGLILSQGGEFAFVAFRMARDFGILNEETTRIMLTCVSLTMAVTPFLEAIGENIANNIRDGEAKRKKTLKRSYKSA